MPSEEQVQDWITTAAIYSYERGKDHVTRRMLGEPHPEENDMKALCQSMLSQTMYGYKDPNTIKWIGVRGGVA